MICPTLQNGIERILREDRQSQHYYLSIIAKDVRGIEVEALDKWNTFFVPNNDYMSLYLGVDAYNLMYGIYTQTDICTMVNKMVFPCYLPSGKLVGWVNYEPLVAAEGSTLGGNHYSFPSKSVFKASAYLFTPPEIYNQALDQSAIILVDGVFDAVSLVHAGFVAAALLRSEVSDEILFQLRWFKTVYLAMDNDGAGLQLLTKLRKHLANVQVCGQSRYKDADDALKFEYRNEYLAKLNLIAHKAKIRRK